MNNVNNIQNLSYKTFSYSHSELSKHSFFVSLRNYVPT